MVWSADTEYKLLGEEKFWVTIRSIHKLITVVPVEEQTFDDNLGDVKADKNDNKLEFQEPQCQTGELHGAFGKKAIMQSPDTDLISVKVRTCLDL
jgi:hypothetical protein